MAAEFYDLLLTEQKSGSDELLTDSFFQRHEQLASELGLAGQKSIATHSLTRLRRPTISTPPLTPDERLIWETFLPTSYIGKRLEAYTFDTIPIHVLEQFREWKIRGVFDTFEIRTEERSLDPALFGIRDGKYWLLARWGRSDETLISLEEIKKLLRERVASDCRDMGIAAGGCLVACLYFIYMGIGTLRSAYPIEDLFFCIPFTVLTFVAAISFWTVERPVKIRSVLGEGAN
jgi:hypothetical protein